MNQVLPVQWLSLASSSFLGGRAESVEDLPTQHPTAPSRLWTLQGCCLYFCILLHCLPSYRTFQYCFWATFNFPSMCPVVQEFTAVSFSHTSIELMWGFLWSIHHSQPLFCCLGPMKHNIVLLDFMTGIREENNLIGDHVAILDSSHRFTSPTSLARLWHDSHMTFITKVS